MRNLQQLLVFRGILLTNTFSGKALRHFFLLKINKKARIYVNKSARQSTLELLKRSCILSRGNSPPRQETAKCKILGRLQNLVNYH